MKHWTSGTCKERRNGSSTKTWGNCRRWSLKRREAKGAGAAPVEFHGTEAKEIQYFKKGEGSIVFVSQMDKLNEISYTMYLK